MAKIRVTRGGCGIEYTDANGNARHTLKTAESGPFECDDAQAARLVGLKVAEYVDEKDADPAVQADAQEAQAEAAHVTEQSTGHQEAAHETEQSTGHLDAAELEKWDYNALKALAADMGVTPEGKKKADYIAAIVAAEVEVDEDDGNELPELSAADPE